jgi:hypothetical protein
MLKLHFNREILIVIISILVQAPLAIFLGHYYDQRSFIDTGYLVSAGLNPYQPHLITIFSSNPDLIGVNPVIGYPPLWPLLLGLIYRLTFDIVPNLFLYNFAIKIPVIASNIALAYITKVIMQQLGASEKKVKAAWLFLLFNPFILLTTTAWGEFDTLIALLCLSSLYLLNKGMMGKSALLLSLSIILKPISLPLLGLPILCSPIGNWRKILTYILICAVIILTLWFLPFSLLGWNLPASAGQLTVYFKIAGGMTPFNIVEIFQDTATLPTGLEFLGYIWIPALLLGYYFVYRNPPKSFNELTKAAVGLLLIFFITRTWISEPNLNLIICFALITLSFKKNNFSNFTFLWVVPLVFLFFNTSFAQQFFLVSPGIILSLVQMDQYIRTWRLVARFAVVVIWQVFAWRLVIELLNHKKVSKS